MPVQTEALRGDAGRGTLVIFDCDGVLIESERLAIRIDEQMLAEIGWDLSREQIIERFMGRSITYMLGAMEEFLGHPIPEERLRAWEASYRRLLEEELEPVEGVMEAIDTLHAAGYGTCVASSSNHDHLTTNLTRVALYDRLKQRIFSATEVEHGKPAPDLFLHAASTLGYAPEQCVVVEDSRYGVQAARAAGMPVLAYAGGGMTPLDALEGPGTTIFYAMSELPGLIRAL